MNELISQLGGIELPDALLREIDTQEIYRDFAVSFRRLDELRRFRSAYEKQNFLVRWWDNDKLRDAQLDSISVQAEFSKAIGRLMLISTLEAGKLLEQQAQLNRQQTELTIQAQAIHAQTALITSQHARLEQRSDELQRAMEDFFAQHGLTDSRIDRLISAAEEVKGSRALLMDQVSRKMLSQQEHVNERIEPLEQHIGLVDERISAISATAAALKVEWLETLQRALLEADGKASQQLTAIKEQQVVLQSNVDRTAANQTDHRGILVAMHESVRVMSRKVAWTTLLACASFALALGAIATSLLG